MTLILLLFFVAIVAWAWSGRRKAVFDSMARMALDDDSQPTSNLPTVKEAHHE
jgi:cbb3-type cytochrome oxidase subunit 3